MALYPDLLIKLLSGFLILILGLIIAQITSNIIKRLIRGTEINKILEQQLKLRISIDNYIGYIIKYVIYLTTIIIALNQIGISTKFLQIILVVFFILVVIFVILSFKDWLPNLISGIYILRTEKIKPGDKIKTKSIKGKVIDINLLETKVETKNNEIIFIPNSNLTSQELTKEK